MCFLVDEDKGIYHDLLDYDMSMNDVATDEGKHRLHVLFDCAYTISREETIISTLISQE